MGSLYPIVCVFEWPSKRPGDCVVCFMAVYYPKVESALLTWAVALQPPIHVRLDVFLAVFFAICQSLSVRDIVKHGRLVTPVAIFALRSIGEVFFGCRSHSRTQLCR